MSSENQNGSESKEDTAFTHDGSTAKKEKFKNLDPDHPFGSFINENASEMCNGRGVLDDFENTFMEQVYRERDSSEGWDAYFDILRDGLKNDNDATVHSFNAGTGSSEVSYVSSKSKTRDNSSSNGARQSEQENRRQLESQQEQKNVHYFRNGTCYFGNPAKAHDVKKTSTEKKKKPELDASELQFYRNLRAHFSKASSTSKSNKKVSQTPVYKKTDENCSRPLEKESTHVSNAGTEKNSPLTAANLNGLSVKDVEEIPGSKTMHVGLHSPKIENISTCKPLAGHKSKCTTENKIVADYSASCSNAQETQYGKKAPSKVCTEESKLSQAQTLPQFGHESTVPSKSCPSISSKMHNTQLHSSNLPKKDFLLLTSEKEVSLESSVKEENLSEKRDLPKSLNVNTDLSNQGFLPGMTSENGCKPTVTMEDKDALHYSPCKEGTSSTQSDLSSSSEKSRFSSSKLKSPTNNGDCSTNCNDSTTCKEKIQMTSKCDEFNNKDSEPSKKHCPPELKKNNFSNSANDKQKSAHKERAKTTQTSKGFSFVNDQSKPHAQRSSSFDKGEFKTTTSKADKKTKKSSKAEGDAPHYSHKSSSTSRLHKERKETRQRLSDPGKDFETYIPKSKQNRQSKEEMIKRISPNETLISVFWKIIHAAKQLGIVCLKGLLSVLYYTLLIAAVIILCLFTVLKGTMIYLYGYVMSLGVTIALIEKLWLGKIYLARWYGVLKEFIREKLFGPRRAAQTYNLPNSGEDAVQTLLVRQGADNDPYRILGVPQEATDEDIRKQYRKFAVLVHPDKNKHPDAAKAFQILSSAYDILGDSNKRQEYDRELARNEQIAKERASGNFMKNPADYKDPQEFFSDLLKQMEEIRESLSCTACQSRHRRIPTDRTVYQARFCATCDTMHQAKEGDFWKESNGLLGMGPGKFYTRMENAIYDITDWGRCQERSGFRLPANTHRVCGKINSNRQQPPPRQRYTEEDFFRDLFGQSGDVGHGQHSHRDQQNKTKQQRRRRKKK